MKASTRQKAIDNLRIALTFNAPPAPPGVLEDFGEEGKSKMAPNHEADARYMLGTMYATKPKALKQDADIALALFRGCVRLQPSRQTYTEAVALAEQGMDAYNARWNQIRCCARMRNRTARVDARSFTTLSPQAQGVSEGTGGARGAGGGGGGGGQGRLR